MSTISYSDNNGNPINFDTAIVAGKANTRINRQLTLDNGTKRRWLWATAGTTITPEMAAQVATDLNINPPETNPNAPTTPPTAAYMPTLMNTPSMGDIIAWDALNARPYALSRTVLKGAPGNSGIDGANGQDGTPGRNGMTPNLKIVNGILTLSYLEDEAQQTPLMNMTSLKGDAGTPGTNGQDGKDGTNGTPGTAGRDGATAYDLAVAAGFTGTLNDWIASLKGQPGTPGADSTTPGPKGDPGQTGQRGTGWTSGTGLPTTTGINQDSYTDLTTGYVYRYLNGAWFQVPNVSMMGPAGKDGTPGTAGQAATIAIASTTTSAPGSNATVTNLGNSTAANLAFTIPQGAPGKDGTPGSAGQDGQAATIIIDSVATGPTPNVTNVGTNTAAKLRFTLPATSTTVNARIDTAETISVTNFANLTTPGPTCNITCGPQGVLTVTISGGVTINGRMTAQITQGATTVFAAHESFSIYSSGGNIQGSRTRTWTGLTPGLTYTITAMYNAPLLGNATFAYREITATTR